jgi:hypothetical protein
MAMIDDLCDRLARDVIAAMAETGDEKLMDKVGKVVLDASPTTHEIYLKAVRALLAEQRGREFLNRTLKAAREGGKAPEAPRGPDAGH